MTRAWPIALLALILIVPARGAQAERLIASVSNHRVTITPNYTGEQLVLFGAIEKDAQTPPARQAYDIIVTVTGPRSTLVTRRKERKIGIWINVAARQFENVPQYIAVSANRAFADIANQDTLRRLQIGLNNFILTQRVGPDFADVVASDPFRAAFVRLKTEHRLYSELPNSVTFLTPTLFRTSIPLPPETPIGTYKVDIVVFSDGAVIAKTESAFEVVKVGFEQFVANAAQNHGILYGLITVMMALMTGWFASIVFRRD